jgi:protein-tyrosine-phosphatase
MHGFTAHGCRFLELVLNPDRAPLSPAERTLMDHHMAKFIRKQGLQTQQGKGKPVTKELLHTWSTIFFLRDAGAALRARRQQHIEEHHAAEERTAKANANIAIHVSKSTAAADFQDELSDPLAGLQNVNNQNDAVEFQKKQLEL